MASHLQFDKHFFHHFPNSTKSHDPISSASLPLPITRNVKYWKLLVSASSHSQEARENDVSLKPEKDSDVFSSKLSERMESRDVDKVARKSKRVFFLDVNPLCYKGSSPCLHSFAHWINLFFSQVSLNDPVIAVLDGEGGNEYRRMLLPSYKANRLGRLWKSPALNRFSKGPFRRSQRLVVDVLQKCNVPVVKIEGHEADDVIATLVKQVLQREYRVVIGSPDKDFKQLISEDVQIVMPVSEFNRWSFYTLKHYIAQYQCDPDCDLSLRCILGDETDGVPGIQHLVPGFGRKTALKLLKKHGSLENLLSTAAIRTVGKQYAQKALTEHAHFLRRNYQVLSLKSDIDIHIEEKWLGKRNTCNDSAVLSNLLDLLSETQDFKWQNRSRVNC